MRIRQVYTLARAATGQSAITQFNIVPYVSDR